MVKHDIDYNYVRPGRIRRFSDWALPIVVAIAACILYIRTVAPSLYWGDSAAFAASNYILGIPHSPSFPLYTLVARLFNLIPNITPAFASNLMSVIFASLSVMLFFMLIKQMTDVPLFLTSRRRNAGGERTAEITRSNFESVVRAVDTETISKPAVVILPCVAAAGLFALSLPVWMGAVRAEVYSFHLFLTLSAALLAFHGTTENKKQILLLGLFVYLLSFANHPLLALAFALPFLYLLAINLPNLGWRLSTFGILALFLVISFSVYFYLPIRAAQDPAINWGRPDNLDSFFSAITRSSDMANFSQMTVAPDYLFRLRKLGNFMAGQIGWPLIGLTLVGFWGIFKVSRRLFLFFPLAIFSNLGIILWAADFNPRNLDLINYLAPLTALLLVTSVAGVMYLLRGILVATQASVAVTIVIGIFIYLGFQDNYARADLSRVNAPEVMCRSVVRDIPAGSVLIAAEDDLLLPLWYSAFVDSTASELKIISAGALVNQKYRKQLTVQYPELVFPENFNGDNGSPAESLTVELCRLNAPHRQIYVQFGAPGINHTDITPAGVLFRYKSGEESAADDKESYSNHIQLAADMLAGNPNEISTIDFTGRWLFNAAVFYERSGKFGGSEVAWKLFNHALNIDRESIDMRVRLAVGLAKAGRLKEALKFISDALEIDPNDKNSLELGRSIVKAIEKQGAVATND